MQSNRWGTERPDIPLFFFNWAKYKGRCKKEKKPKQIHAFIHSFVFFVFFLKRANSLGGSSFSSCYGQRRGTYQPARLPVAVAKGNRRRHLLSSPVFLPKPLALGGGKLKTGERGRSVSKLGGGGGWKMSVFL